MTVGQSFLTKIEKEFLFLMSSSVATLETRVKCVVSDFDVTSNLRSDSLLGDEPHISLTKTELSIIINTAVF